MKMLTLLIRQLQQAALANEDPVQVVGDGEDLCKLARQLRREAEEVAGSWGENIRWGELVHPGVWDCNCGTSLMWMTSFYVL